MRSGIAIACLLFAAAVVMARRQKATRGGATASRAFAAVVCACLATAVAVEMAAFWLLQRGGYAPRGAFLPIWGAGIGLLVGVVAFAALTITAFRVRQPDEGIGAQVFGCSALVVGPLLGACCGALLALLP